jgi:hypothetical protein
MELTFNDKAFKLCHNLKQGEELIVAEKIKPENREQFIKSVQMIIYCGYDKLWGYVLEISQDKTKVRKNGIWY